MHCSLVQSCIALFSRLGLSLIIVPVVAIIDAAAIAKGLVAHRQHRAGGEEPFAQRPPKERVVQV